MNADLFTKDRGHLARMSACCDKSAPRGRIALLGWDHGARCSMDGLGQDVPATMKRPLFVFPDDE
jgi:hypothetical protein